MAGTNLIEAIRFSAKSLKGVTFIKGHDYEEFLPYSKLYESALKVLSALQKKGFQPNDELVFQIRDDKNFLIVFWACIFGGVIPIPLTFIKNDDHREKVYKVWGILKKPYLVISKDDLDSFYSFDGRDDLQFKIGGRTIFLEDILSSAEDGKIVSPNGNDIAFVQFSSGSTGNPKGVILTHNNLISNLEGISEAANYSDGDSMLSWMPLTHDMGMIGFHLNPIFCGIHQYLIPVEMFVRQPAIWLDKATEHRATILCSPNFGYRYLLKHLKNERQWDLSNVRILYNGAEPISEELCQEFNRRLSKYKLRNRAMRPVYGLAEASVAVSMSRIDDKIESLRVNLAKLNVGDKIEIEESLVLAPTVVNVGKSIKHCTVRITTEKGKSVEDSVIGHILIKGSNVTAGYYNNADASKEIIDDEGWLDTGDLGFVINGDLFITGRSKDVIFINGQNYYPHDIERVAEGVDGVELNKIVATSFFNHETLADEVLVFVLHRGSLHKFMPIAQSLKAHLNERFGFALNRVIPVKDIPRTTSGKLQRFKLLKRYESGEFKKLEAELNCSSDSFEDKGMSAPDNEVEEKVLAIWKELLQTERLGVNDKFFEVGGNSLKAAELNMKLQQVFQVELPFEKLFNFQTVRNIAFQINRLEEKAYSPISKAKQLEFYPMSSLQRRIYYAWKFDPSSIAYNIPTVFKLRGHVSISRLLASLKELIFRHDSLRTTFHLANEPLIKVQKEVDVTLDFVVCAREECNLKLKGLVVPFDLTNGPLFRFHLVKIENSEEYLLFLDFHHVISDGQSIYYFVDELLQLYGGIHLPLINTSYVDFIMWEQQHKETKDTLKKYWANRFSDDLPLLEMPIDYRRPIVFNGKGRRLEFEFNRKVTKRLNQISVELGVTLHVLIFTFYNILLSKYCGQEDIIIGIPVLGRRHPDLQRTHGMFVNVLPIRNRLNFDSTFADGVNQASKAINEALDHQDLSFDDLLSIVQVPPHPGRSPLFDTMFVYQSAGITKRVTSDFEMSQYGFDPGFSKFDISMEVFEHSDQIKYAFEYSSMLFKDDSILNLAASLERIVVSALENQGMKISELSSISHDEFHDFVVTYNDTGKDYQYFKTVQQLFEEQVIKSPAAIAIFYDGRSFTYAELNERANQLGHALNQKGISNNDIVGICLPKSPELIISILGILKAGGACLLLGIDLPIERILYAVEDSQCKLIISNNQLNDLKDRISVGILAVRNLLSDTHCANLEIIIKPLDLAYVIYTSGTTGRPKGVTISHKSLGNYILWASEQYVTGHEVSFALYSSISFDLTITSIFTPLSTGNKIVIYEEDNAELLIERVVSDNHVDVLKLTPSHLKVLRDNNLLSSESKIKRFIVGGESLDRELAMDIYELMKGRVEIFNEYGPTEATVGCMIYKFDPSDSGINVPIGKPIANTQIYLLDKHLKPVPSNVLGEIFISGDGLASGYLFEQELTRKLFIDNPFIPGQKMYRTGDLATRLPNGTLNFVGRKDDQVKIKGYRIELAEIQNHLIEHDQIKDAVVKLDEIAGTLCAYYTLKMSDSSIRDSDLRRYLAERLPYYMIPVRFTPLEFIPLTKNGKVNASLLPKAESAMVATTGSRPLSEVEKISLEIWKEVLGEPDLDSDDNFFELGGDSIKAVQISSRLYERGISIKVKDILTYHTIEEISSHAERIDGGYDQRMVEGEIELTPIITWFFNQRYANPNYYNQSVLLKMRRHIDVALVQNAFVKLIEHHDTLRLNFDPEKNVLFYNNEHLNGKFQVEEYSLKDTQMLSEVCNNIRSAFSITNGLLVKAAIIKETDGAEYLFITAHHLIMDGVSWRILLEDLYHICMEQFSGKVMVFPSKTASFKHWTDELYAFSATRQFGHEKNYWEAIEQVDFVLPQDLNAEDWTSKTLKTVVATLDKETTYFLLRNAHKTYNADVPILLNAALVLALNEWTNLEEFIIEQENHGRHLQEINLTRSLGWFTAIYPIRLEYHHEIGELIKSVKEAFRKIPNHGMGYGIDKYLQNNNEEIFKRSEIRFNYLGQFSNELDNELLSLSLEFAGAEVDPGNNLTTKLELNSMVIGEQLRMEFNYNSKAFNEATVNQLAESFIRNLTRLQGHIKNEDDVHFTPSDFSTVDLTQDDLRVLFGQ